MNQHGKVAVITGAAGHLGRAVAAKLGQQGAYLVLIDKIPINAIELPPVHGGQVSYQADILDADQLRHTVKEVIASQGRVDMLCHVAGGFRMGEPVHEISSETWKFMMELNARSLIHAADAVVPHMIQQGCGHIVTVAASAAMRGKALMGAYCASKSSMVRLTEALSAELLDKHINVNCVLPSIIDTADNRAAMPDEDFTRWVDPDDLAEVIAFLCSDLSRAVHGATIPVTGRVIL